MGNHHAEEDVEEFIRREMEETPSETCKRCGGSVYIRSPGGHYEHLCWPDFLDLRHEDRSGGRNGQP